MFFVCLRDKQDVNMLRKRQIKEGRVIRFRGEQMLLIKHDPSWRIDGIPYIYSEEEDGNINFKSERWLVEIDGFRTHRYIHFFHSRGDLPAECKAWENKDELRND